MIAGQREGIVRRKILIGACGVSTNGRYVVSSGYLKQIPPICSNVFPKTDRHEVIQTPHRVGSYIDCYERHWELNRAFSLILIQVEDVLGIPLILIL